MKLKKLKFLGLLLAIVVGITLIACDNNTQDAPDFSIEGKTATTITVAAVPGGEYSKDGGEEWQISRVFTGLTPSTTYQITVRMRATKDLKASDPAAIKSVTTNAAVPLLRPANVKKESGFLVWDEVDNADGYVVMFEGGQVRVSENSILLTTLPYEQDLSLIVKAVSDSGEYSDSPASTPAVIHNNGSIIIGESESLISATTVNTEKVDIVMDLKLTFDLILSPMQQGDYTPADAKEAYRKFFYGTAEEKAAVAEKIGNDVLFAVYVKGERSEPLVVKNKFWDDFLFEDGTVIDGTIGLDGYTLNSTSTYRTVFSFPKTAYGVTMEDLHGKTLVAEIGVIMDGFYYSRSIEISVPDIN